MLQQLRIAPQLILLLILQLSALLIVGGIAARGFWLSSQEIQRSHHQVSEQIALSEMNAILRAELPAILDDVLAARMTWEQGRSDIRAMKNLLNSQWTEFRRAQSGEELSALEKEWSEPLATTMLALEELDRLFSEPEETRLTAWRYNTLSNLLNPLTTRIDARIAQHNLDYQIEIDRVISTQAWHLYGGLVALVLVLVVIGMTARRFYVSIAAPLQAIEVTTRAASEGDQLARINLRGSSEWANIARSIDQILDDRNNALLQSQQQQDQISNSLAMLQQTLTELGARDYTARAPQVDDATGPIAVAVNLVAEDTGRMLTGIRRIADQLAKTSAAAHAHTDVMLAMIDQEQSRVDAALPMHASPDITSEESELLTVATISGVALNLMTDATACLTDLTKTLNDTKKHATRLESETFEMGQAVAAFRRIADRAHIVAVNANLQEMMASGAENRHGANTASELQLLVENMHSATRQVDIIIGNLQQNIHAHAELLDAVTTQTAASSAVAHHAGEQLQHAHQLAEAQAMQTPRNDNQQLKAGLAAARAQLLEHQRHTQRLTQFSRGLLTAAKSFSLPAESPNDQKQTSSDHDAAHHELQQQAS